MENKSFLALPLLIILISLTSAQVLVTGKVYNSDFSGPVSVQNMNVTCNDNGNLNTLSTDNLSDGTYAVIFDDAYCGLGDNVKVSFSNSDLSGSGTGTVTTCEEDCDTPYLSVINLALKAVQTDTSSSSSSSSSSGGGGGGSSHGYFNCGNNKCDTGETEKTCPKDCVKIISNNQTNQTTTNLVFEQQAQGSENNNLGNNNTETTNTQESKGTQSGILGAVTGLGKSLVNSIILIGIVFIVAIILVILIVSRLKAKRRRKISNFIGF